MVEYMRIHRYSISSTVPWNSMVLQHRRQKMLNDRAGDLRSQGCLRLSPTYQPIGCLDAHQRGFDFGRVEHRVVGRPSISTTTYERVRRTSRTASRLEITWNLNGNGVDAANSHSGSGCSAGSTPVAQKSELFQAFFGKRHGRMPDCCGANDSLRNQVVLHS